MALGSIAFRTAQRIRRNRSLQVLREITAYPRLDAEAAATLQARRLSALLAHAERHVPYYRDLFRSLKLTSRDIRTPADLDAFPILTKDIICERWRDLIREDVPLEQLSAHHSGGSTGIPLRFYRHASYMAASEAGTYRNLAQAGWKPGDMVAFFWGWNERLERMHPIEFELRQWIRRMYQFDPFRSGPADMDRWYERMKRLRPKVALGYASTIARFAEHLEATDRRPRPLQGVFTTAEVLLPQQREVIERVFDCKVFDCYGSSEVQNISSECIAGGMHVNVDFVVLEQEEPDEPGGASPLIVTSLLNYAMPFIRYRNEDRGRLLDGSCDCGGGFPLMELRIARISDNFIFANGAVVHGEFFTHLMYGSEGIDRFQFHQVAVDRIILRIVPGPGNASDRDRAVRSAVAQIESLAPGEVTIDVQEVADIPLSSAGKHRFTRSDVAMDSAANIGSP